ncbi:nuclear pore complex protein Nup205 [Haematobia irritans]|uniref:nuclear pore complex protein Nup205 n=1 Tax=Haematobia irritans TaxID=7368 RepID=UPI003F50D26F
MEGIPDDMWSPFKQLYKVIEQTIVNPNEAAISNLEVYLKRHKQIFVNLLRNPPKNESNRSQLRAYVTQGVPVAGNRVPLSKELIDESIIVSDMFDLDEFLALELLCTAQHQQIHYPGLPRGLVAVLLYYDGRKAIANSIRDLFQIVSGVSWIPESPKQLVSLVSSFCQTLVDDSNILDRIVDLLDELDIVKETVMLTKNRALGDNKHQNQVIELFEDVRVSLASALFNWSAQRGLPKFNAIRLLKSLSQNRAKEANGEMENTTLTMLMALLYSYDTSILQKQDDSILIQNLSIIKDHEFVQHMYGALMNAENPNCNNGIVNLVKFSFGLAISGLRHASQQTHNHMSITDYDEQLVDDAIASNIFKFIYCYILEKEAIYQNQFFYLRLHTMFGDFIDFMHSKVTELRGRADETSKTVLSFAKEGLEPPNNLDHNFEMLLLCIGKFYADDRAGLSLCSEYWGPLEASSNYATTTRSVSLFKFIRLAGELLPATLFVPYLKMIAGLSSCERSSRSTFNLLKQSTGLTGSAALSWEHFFSSLSRYYTNLKQDFYTSSDSIYRSRMINRNINPQEIEGLRAVLEVIRAVTSHDEVARIAICEHPNWNPLFTLIGLLSCSVPIYLKSDILKTLAALGRSKETAIPLWNNLEASQIIKTLPSNMTYDTCNLEMEIEQNECRMEHYPLTSGILDLLYSLVSTVIPKNLGAGPRKPGLDPYLKFVINGIFLKFYNRTYKQPSERWSIGAQCLKFLHYLLEIYEVNPCDFEDNIDFNPHPGYHIMLNLQTKSDTLRLMLQIIDDARMELDDLKKFKGKGSLEECALLCLKIIKLGLKNQDIFFEAHSLSNSAVLLSGLNKIMLDINPRSRKPDHVLNTTYFLTYFNWLPHHALEAVKILHMVSNQPGVNSQIVGIFTQNEATKTVLRHGFVECLEMDFVQRQTKTDDAIETDGLESPKVHLQIKEAIIMLIQDCLYQPTPNLAQFLLGFDYLNDAHCTNKNRLGLFDLGINCTKSLVFLLEIHLQMKRNSNCLQANVENIMERCFSLLYSLCENPKTSDQILRFLRTRNDFLCRYLNELPVLVMENAHVINQISYLLKCIAIELKQTASSCQLSRFQHISDFFLGMTTKNQQDSISTELNHFCANNATVIIDTTTNTSVTRNNLLCELMNSIELEVGNTNIPHWNFFEKSLLDQIFKECEYKTTEGHKLIDLKKIHATLHGELQIVQSTIASGQRRLVLQEIESVLLYALQINEQRSKRFAILKFVEAWSQVSEVLFSCVPNSCLALSKKQELIIEILQKILLKITPSQTTLEISAIISETILILLVNLRNCFSNASKQEYDRNEQIAAETGKHHPSKSNALNIKFILKYLLEWIIVSGVVSQKLRINLYASLLNCLSIVKEQNSRNHPALTNENLITRLDKSRGNDTIYSDTTHIKMAIEVLLSFGDKLMETICHDCIAGHDICKMSALACIDVLLDIDSMAHLMNFIAHHGYLSHIIESIAKSDNQLCSTLSNAPENMKCLYVYESKMSMLLRFANTHIGAELLLSNKVLDVLSNMKVLDKHPDLKRKEVWQRNEMREFVPAFDYRFRQILFPALNVCDCLISTLGTENYSVLSQVMHFLFSHWDMIEIILRSGSPFSDLGLLEELSLITGVIARTFNQETLALVNIDSTGDIGVNLYRIQKLMLSIYARFVISDVNFKEMLKPDNALYEQSDENISIHIKYFLEVAANLTLFCRNIVTNNAADHRTNGLLFSPQIHEPVRRRQDHITNTCTQFNIGIVVDQLKGSVEYYHSQKAIYEGLLRQRSVMDNISFDSTAKDKYAQINKQLIEKQSVLYLCVFIAEQCLYLLWSHLDYYIRYSASTKHDMHNYEDNAKTSMYKCSREELENLKKYLVLVFNETFSKQLCSTNDEPESKYAAFNTALLRRIKSLIQCFPSD